MAPDGAEDGPLSSVVFPHTGPAAATGAGGAVTGWEGAGAGEDEAGAGEDEEGDGNEAGADEEADGREAGADVEGDGADDGRDAGAELVAMGLALSFTTFRTHRRWPWCQ
jgi:hypothetical protein